MKLVAYLRVSSAVQVEAWGLERQEAAVKTWARQNGHRISEWRRDEGVSGTIEALDRPGLSEAIELVSAGAVDGIVVADLDRLARKLTVQEAALALVWRASGRVFTATSGEVLTEDPDDPSRNLIRQVMGAVIEYEKGMSVMRMRHGKKAKALTGRKTDGQYAFGYQQAGTGRDKDAGPEPQQQATVQRIVDMRNDGRSYREICDVLNGDGVLTKFGKSWVPMTVKRIYDRTAA
jgi:DNA invertase Pin-like site-specific DNA recombinase